MRRTAILGLATVLAAGLGAGPALAAATTQHIAVPAYFSPSSSYWSQLTQGAPAVGVAIANPDNGPGTAFDQGYATAIRAAANAGVRVIGYVDTGYFGTTGRTTRTGQTTTAAWTAQSEGDVATWYSLYGGYGLGGIFFDDGLADCGHVGLYQAVNTYTKQNHPGAYTVDNPGTAAEQCYADAADTIVMFEGTYASYTGWSAPAWELSYGDPNKFYHLVYATPSQANEANAMALSKQRNAGYVYVTPDDLPNPWDTLPTGAYWSDELTRALSSGGGGGGGTGCASSAGSGAITAISACKDATSLRFQATYNTAASFHHVYLNTDNNAATGFQLPSPSPSRLGADYMIENNILYRSLSAGWSWTPVTGVSPNMTVSGATYSWTVPLSALANPAASQQAVFNGNTFYTNPLTYGQ
ncbi:spherulation-specific family 4 protein [Actinoplanes sp. KI2]|uniref:spherulation-specific family 4 protein n=1 Tax=Actinoplanes sp. KI2 TaxID=2983315 RepID=UPI0021D599CB|nr:spherulation-specific family 4 protein [Actinoplanes sp. KI2]MCU7728927.1 spherulation-specific family 4 protein [Actinoplanes sp. KI2]